MPLLGQPIPAAAWFEDGALVIGLGEHTAKVAARGDLAPFAREVLEGKWVLASWGRGLYALTLTKMLSVLGPSGDPSMMKAQLSLMSHVTEWGVAFGWDDDGFRALLQMSTTFANPDDVVTALEPLLTRLAGGDASAVADIEALASRHPGSPLAETVDSGGIGAVAAMFVPAIVAAVAIPAFMRNARKAKTVEATVNVKKLHDGASAYYQEAKRFPGPSAATTPASTCCGHPGDKCTPDPSLWDKDPWKSLKFSMDDPHYYRYEYEVAADGRSFSARALGDLDCDGVYSTFEMVGAVGTDGTITGGAGMYSNNDLE